MVVLVRCIDNTYSLALEARLTELIDDGLIAAFFREGEWVRVDRAPARRDYLTPCPHDRRLTAMVSSF